MEGIRTRNDCYKWIETTEMFDRMLQHRPSYVLNPLNRRNLNNVSLRSENNKIQRLVNLDYVKDICPVSVENLNVDYSEITDLSYFEKVRDRLGISHNREL